MKIIEIPATLRIFVADDTSPEEIRELADSLLSDTSATVESRTMDEDLKKHILTDVGKETLADKIAECDLWVHDLEGKKIVVHENC
jgi:hypothetical protein